MGFVMIYVGIYLITASTVLTDVMTNSLPIDTEGELAVNAINSQIAIAEDVLQIQEQKSKLDNLVIPFRSDSARDRTRRSTRIQDDVLASRIALLIVEEEHEDAFSLYSKAIQTSDNKTPNSSNQTKWVQWIVQKAYQKSTVTNILSFITSKLNDPGQICLWINALFETMKMKNHLASIEGLYFEHATKSALEERQQEFNQVDKLYQKCDFKLLVETISNDLIEPTQQLLGEWAKSIQSGNDRHVINAATNYNVEFNSIVHQLIPMAIGFGNSKYESNTHFAEWCEKTIDFILRTPSSTMLDALFYFNQTLQNIDTHFISMSERMMLAYALKDLELYVETNVELPLQSRQMLTTLANQIQLSVKRIVWDSYVFIYKYENTKGGTKKFMSSDKSKKFSSEKTFTRFYESHTMDTTSQWVLEPINNADQFRIKNEESGEYLFADDVSSVWGFSNKRSVFTYKLEHGSDINNNSLGDRLIWVLTPIFGNDKTVRFTIMNLYWKEYLDSHESRLFNEMHTWKNKVNPPKSARHWIISDGSDRPTPKTELKGTRLVCLFESSATQREGAGRFTVDNIDPSLCTHLVYSKARIDNMTLVMTIGDEKIDIIDKGYEKIVALKQHNPQLKVMIALGGWGVEEIFSHLLSDEENIDMFVESAINFLQIYKFDGIHFELQFLHNQKNGITLLLTALSNAFKSRNYLLSVTLSSLGSTITNGYDISLWNEMLDFISLMTFKYHGHWEDKVYHHAPLYHRPGDDVIKIFNLDFAVKMLIWEGASLEKIVLGIPFFGMSWALESNDTKPLAQASRGAAPGRIMKSKDKMAYYEICEAVQNDGWEMSQDPDQKMGPYAVSPPSSNKRTWVGFDDPAMAVVKANYILAKGLGGAFVSDVSQDDFLNTCGGGFNPMLTAIAKTFEAKTSICTII